MTTNYPLPSDGGRRIRKRWTEADTGYDTPCWISTLAKSELGYARERCGDTVGYAHRHAYERAHGPIPEGMSIDHLCRIRSCVNPAHLEPATQAENVQRGRLAKLSLEGVRAIRASTEPQRLLARRYGVSQGQISRIRTGVSWRAVN